MAVIGIFIGAETTTMTRSQRALLTMGAGALGLLALQWIRFGYSLAFAPDAFKGLIGGLNFVGLNGVGLKPDPTYAATIPHQAFMVFQLMFAVITPALISGAFAERMKFSSYI